MTNDPVDSDGTALRAYRFGEYFAQLAEAGACEVIRVADDFWETGLADLPPGRLVSLIESSEDWPNWERHPSGEELILQLTGVLEIILENGAEQISLLLRQNDFAIVPTGMWHTANVPEPGTALYITLGEGTEHRRRD